MNHGEIELPDGTIVNGIVKNRQALMEIINGLVETNTNEATDISGAQDLITSQPKPEVVLLQIEKFTSESNNTVNLLKTVTTEEETNKNDGPVKNLYLVEETATTLKDANLF